MTLMAPSGDVVCFAPNIPNMIQYPMVYVQTGMTGPMVSWAPSCDGNAATNATVATSANTNMSGMVDAATAWWPHQAMQNGQNLQVQQMQTQAQQATLQPQPQPPVQQAMLQQVMAQAQVQPQQNQMQQVQMHQSQMQQAQVHIQQVQLQAQMHQAAQMQSQMQQMPMQQLPLQPVQQNQLPDQMDKKIFHHPPSQFQVVRVSDDSQPKPLFNAPVRLTPAQGPTSDETGNVQDQTDAQQQPKLEPQAATAQKHQQHQPQRQQKQQAVAAQHDNRPHAHPGLAETTTTKASGKLRTRRKEPGVKTASDHAKLFQTLRSHLEVGDNEVRLDAIHQIQGNVVALAMESESSSRAVQMALKVATRQTATELSAELTGHIAEVSLSLHGNHVLQRVIEVLPSSKTSFIAEELMTRAAEVARNVFGCRIFCRLLEQSANLTSTQKLLAKVMRDSEDLVQNQFGRYVAQAILEHGTDDQRHTLAGALCPRIVDLAQHRNASHVIEKALTYCSVDDRRALAVQLLQQDPRHQDTGVETLARTQYGGFVVKALLNLGGDVEAEARRQLLGLSGRFPELKGASKETRFAERLLKELGYLPEEEDADLFGKDGQSARAGRVQRKPPRRTGLAAH